MYPITISIDIGITVGCNVCIFHSSIYMKRIEEQFSKAYDEYSKGILRHIYFRVSNWNVAEDITQETFFKAWRSIASQGSGVKIKSFKAFFYKIANNLTIDYYRGKYKQTVSLEDIKEKELTYEATQEKEIQCVIEKNEMKKYLSLLKDEYRQMLLYRYMDDLSIKEIAGITGKSPNNIRVIRSEEHTSELQSH